VPKWSDFGNIVATIREVDVTAVAQEAELGFSITCVGHSSVLPEISRLLHRGIQRYPLLGASPVVSIPIEESVSQGDMLQMANLFVVALDARQALSERDIDGLHQLDRRAVPYVVVLLYGTQMAGELQLPAAAVARLAIIPEPLALSAQDLLASTLLDRLPSELHMAAARRLPGLRGVYSQRLINSTAFSNASYALASGLPEQIPVISIPFAAADILILTKNQALLVFRIALAHGAEPNFQARIREIVPVIGSAFLWRQAARSLIGLIPVWGLVPKIAIAYAGTYATGVAAWRWFEQGHTISGDQLKRLSQEALAIGKTKATELVDQARATSAKLRDQVNNQARILSDQASQQFSQASTLMDRVRRKLPFRRDQ
jgi:uncharacterized protein (DUF697 family)